MTILQPTLFLKMKTISKAVSFFLIYGAVSFASGDEPTEEVLVYRGTSDTSAAVAISKDMFIGADDENNILRVYKTSIGGQEPYFTGALGPRFAGALPIYSYDMTEFLGAEPKHPEADIEGATMMADRTYWITSHGRNKDGEMRPSRYRFFATTVKVQNGKVTINPIGKPCKTLLHQLINAEHMRHLGLDKATRFDEILTEKHRKKLAPKEKGLNIEALCASNNGKTLYIGFRNPRPYNRETRRINALVVSLENPEMVVEKGDAPIFGEPILWDLGGRGIRSMEYSHYHKAYFIIAGPHDEPRPSKDGLGERPTFALYCWSGKKGEQPVLVRELRTEKSKFSPEALIPFRESARLLLLSDDGSLVIKVGGAHECMEGEYRSDGTCLNKFLIDPNKKTFRGVWLEP